MQVARCGTPSSPGRACGGGSRNRRHAASSSSSAFDLWYTHNAKTWLVVLYFEARGKNDPIWLAMSSAGGVTHDAKQLPKGAFNAMYRLTQ